MFQDYARKGQKVQIYYWFTFKALASSSQREVASGLNVVLEGKDYHGVGFFFFLPDWVTSQIPGWCYQNFPGLGIFGYQKSD